MTEILVTAAIVVFVVGGLMLFLRDDKLAQVEREYQEILREIANADKNVD